MSAFRYRTIGFSLKLWGPTDIVQRLPMGPAKPLRAMALIVEDDAARHDMIGLLLAESGYAVVLCESAEDAVSVIQESNAAPHPLMTDVQLAGPMAGVQLARIAKQRDPMKVRIPARTATSPACARGGHVRFDRHAAIAHDRRRRAF